VASEIDVKTALALLAGWNKRILDLLIIQAETSPQETGIQINIEPITYIENQVNGRTQRYPVFIKARKEPIRLVGLHLFMEVIKPPCKTNLDIQ